MKDSHSTVSWYDLLFPAAVALGGIVVAVFDLGYLLCFILGVLVALVRPLAHDLKLHADPPGQKEWESKYTNGH